MKYKILKYSLECVVAALIALTMVACGDKEYTVDTGDSQAQQQTSARPLVSDIETINIPNSDVSFEMVLVCAGTFTMGGVDAEGPEHQVTLSHDFYIGQTEVTQALFRAVMDTSYSEFNYGGNYPADNVSHMDAVEFCRKLTKLTGYRFTLPTEAQWEYAAQGGHRAPSSRTDYAGSNNIGSVGWYWDNSPHYQTEDPFTHVTLTIRHTSAVRSKQANNLGVYDMTGNVREWCSDWYSVLGSEDVTDPEGPLSSSLGHVYRGGSCNDSAKYCRVAHRESLSSLSKGFDFGFRVVINMQ